MLHQITKNTLHQPNHTLQTQPNYTKPYDPVLHHIMLYHTTTHSSPYTTPHTMSEGSVREWAAKYDSRPFCSTSVRCDDLFCCSKIYIIITISSQLSLFISNCCVITATDILTINDTFISWSCISLVFLKFIFLILK